MIIPNLETSPIAYVRAAGSLSLIIAILGGFRIASVPSVIIEPGHAVATALNLPILLAAIGIQMSNPNVL